METEKIKEIIQDYKNKPNKDLTLVMDYINEEFNKTKKSIIDSTYYLDTLEKTYNQLLKEYQKRNGVK
jgi:type III secretory pathway component EscV